jgi:hypothetical protein
MDVDESGQAEGEPAKSPSRRRRKVHPLTPPPPASDFPPYEPRDFFRYEVLHRSKVSGARVGRIHTPHGAKGSEAPRPHPEGRPLARVSSPPVARLGHVVK